MTTTLPAPLQRRLESGLLRLLAPDGHGSGDDFLLPHGEAALTAPDSVSWAVFKNPLVVFIGGVAAVLLELAEPRVRSGVWEHTTFRAQPLARLQRTGFAAMLTVYGARSRVEPMIARVACMHQRVHGHTPDGRAYCAADPELLDWVQATASFGFVQAHHVNVGALSPAQHDRFYAEGAPAARLYGAVSAPTSQAELQSLFDACESRLEASPIVFDFIRVVREMPALPRVARPVQALLIRAAVQLVPPTIRDRLGLGTQWNLAPWQHALLCRACRAGEHLLLRTHPAVQACRRLWLAEDFLYA